MFKESDQIEKYVDDQALYELILNTFYNEVSAGEDTE